jgi:hypothetical protein
VTRETSFLPSLHFLWCMAQRLLHVLTKFYYRSMPCFASNSPAKGPTCSAKDSLAKGPSYTMRLRQITKYVAKSVTKYDANPHSTMQDTPSIVFLISKQVIPFRTCGGTCCPRVSTHKIRSSADSSTTCHDGINHLHHSNHCSNYSIDPHMVNSHVTDRRPQYSHKDTGQTQHHK